MKHPDIKLTFDEKLDQEIAWQFYSNPEFGGTDFWSQGAVKHHLQLKNLHKKDNPEKYLKKYISSFYLTKSSELETLSEQTVGYLNQTVASYFEIVDKIFNNYPWPQKAYTGVFSIFDFCPRFLDWGGFQIFLHDTKNLQLFTIYHEMLHFIFYDYVIKKFPKRFAHMDTETGTFWDLAEVFNAVIQQTEDFINLHGKIKEIGYPDHKQFIVEGKKIWNKTLDLDQWIQQMMPLLIQSPSR